MIHHNSGKGTYSFALSTFNILAYKGVGKNIEVIDYNITIYFMNKTFTTTLAGLVFVFAITLFAGVSVNTAAAWGGGGSEGGGGGGSYGGDGCGGCGSAPTPTPTPTPTPAICNYLRTNISEVPHGGGNVTLTWSSSRGTSATLTPTGAAVALNGSQVVNVTQNTTFTFRVVNADGADSCHVSVTVKPPVVVPLPVCKFLTADPYSFSYGGGNTTLSWATLNASKVTLVGYGEVAANGTRVVPVTQTTTFTLKVENAKGSVDCTKTVTVKPLDKAPSCDAFTVSPTTLPYGGGNVTLNWATTDAGTVTINNGVGVVEADGSRTVNVTQTTLFTLIAEKAGKSSASCTAKVIVEPKHEEPKELTCADNVTFSATPRSLPVGGGTVNLSWTTTGLDAISITDVSNPGFNGSASVTTDSSKTYTLTATADGKSVQCPVSVTVDTRSGGGGGSSTPRCELKISKKSINRGDSVTLTWDTTRATSIKLVDNNNNVIVESTDKDDLDGSITIRPTKDTTYTLSAIRTARSSRDCKVSVDVKDAVVVSETRNQLPVVAGISLTQVPYTGFEAGPMLTTIFYILLTIWGLFVAYVVAVRRDMIGGVSLVGAHDHVPYTEASSASQFDVSPAAEYVAAVTTPDVPANLPTGVAPVVGYAAAAAVEVDEMTQLENRAHAEKALFSSDAMRYFMKITAAEDRATGLDQIIAKAKAAFPSEDGWLVINLARLESLLETNNAAAVVAETVTPGNGGSLAEAIVTGNIVAAYQLIAHRPMIALADAATELDMVVRARRGEQVTLSNLLAAETAALTDAQVTAAIKALTGALDGVYTSEEEAVKMAIMKAVKAVV